MEQRHHARLVRGDWTELSEAVRTYRYIADIPLPRDFGRLVGVAEKEAIHCEVAGIVAMIGGADHVQPRHPDCIGAEIERGEQPAGGEAAERRQRFGGGAARVALSGHLSTEL